MNSEKLSKQLAFIHEIDKVKYIQRNTRLFNSNRRENDAEHSWHLAMMAIVLAGHANENINLLKVLKMLLIHDVVEIDAGDVFFFDTAASYRNNESERKAAQRIFGMLPAEQAQEMIAVWEEFEAGETAEAKFARAMDRFEPVLQNVSNSGGTWNEKNVPYEQVIEKLSVIGKGAQDVWDAARQMIDETAQKGFIRRAGTEGA
jgi:putative hydrolases of HD superfamily